MIQKIKLDKSDKRFQKHDLFSVSMKASPKKSHQEYKHHLTYLAAWTVQNSAQNQKVRKKTSPSSQRRWQKLMCLKKKNSTK